MKKIPLIKPEINVKQLSLDIKKISESGILTKGNFVKVFEERLKKYLIVKYVFTTTSCTSALHLALAALDISSGDEVLVSDFSFPASANSICYTGAKPIFVDIDMKTLTIETKDLLEKISKKTKAIMVVHPFGYPANMPEIARIAKKYNLKIIEDAACAIGSKINGKFCGTYGDLGCFSFHPRKVLTTGEGGAVVTNDKKIAQKIEILRNHGSIKTQAGLKFVEVGYNYRLSEIQAALGAEQLKGLDKIIKRRRKLASYYKEKLSKIPQISLQPEKSNVFLNFQSFVILLPSEKIRDGLSAYLQKFKVETVLGTYAQHLQPAYTDFSNINLPNSANAYNQTLTLPLYGQMDFSDIDYIVSKIAKWIKCNA